MNYRAVIWDLGGVLVRTDDPLPRQALAQRLGHTRASLDQLVFGGESSRRAQLGELTEHQHWENVRQMLGLQIEALSEFQREFWGGDRLDHELVDFIRSLRRDYRTGLLSNNFSSLRSNLSTHWQIADAFDVIVISSEVHLLKPDARIYQLTLDQLQVQPEQAIFVDDFIENINGAQAAGMQVVHFQNPRQAKAELIRLLGNKA